MNMLKNTDLILLVFDYYDGTKKFSKKVETEKEKIVVFILRLLLSNIWSIFHITGIGICQQFENPVTEEQCFFFEIMSKFHLTIK